ncbi:MAG: hypothetical protein ACQEQY_04750 [Halobacteriota archaeon]
MTPTIRAHPVDDPSMATRVRHYDELPEDAKERLPTLLEGGNPVVPAETAAGFRHGELVKFTRYYRIEILDDPVGVRADSSS